MIEYLIFGAGMYIGMSLKDPKGFIDADLASLLRGLLLCWVLWPIGLIAKIVMILTDKETNEKDP